MPLINRRELTNTTSTLVNTTLANQSSNPRNTVVNFALNGKLLANQSIDNGRIIVSQPSANSAPTLSLPIILVLIFILASIVGIIVTALFVMRRRFSTWRLDSSKPCPNGDGESGDLTENIINKESLAEKTEATTKAETLDEKPEVVKEAETTPTPTTIETAQPEAAQEAQASPTSASPLINQEEQVKPEPTTIVDEPAKSSATPQPEQVTSSSSLIVNVLNELSESVACKLAGEVTSDPEKEPLKNVE